MWRYRAFRLVGLLTEALPLPLAYLLSLLIAEISFSLNTQGRRVAVANMRHVLGPCASPARVRGAARGCFRAAAWYYADLARTPQLQPARFIEHNLRISGIEHLERAAASGRGCIAASLHYGSPEYAAQCLGARGITFMALVEPLEPPELSALFRRYRTSHGHIFVDVGLRGTRRAIKHLRRGGTLAVLVDRDIQHNGIEVSFLGAPARMPSGAVDLALYTGALIVPFITRRTGLNRFEAIIEPPLELARTGVLDTDRRLNTGRLLQTFEKYLRRDPSQWFVLEEPVWRARADHPPCRPDTPLDRDRCRSAR